MNIKSKVSNALYQIYIICLYIPIYFRLFLYCLQYKTSPALLFKVNPSFPYGGVLPPKTSVFEKFQVNKKEFARFFCKTLAIRTQDSFKQKITKAQDFIKKYHLQYPLILKPDDGIGGMGLQFIENRKALFASLKIIKKDHILQAYIPRPLELSVFFIRHPGEKGRIRSLTRRYTIKEEHEPELMIPIRRIICKDESYLITPALERIFNAISAIPGFHFGRFDIRVHDMPTFISKGTGFKIIEVNVGAHSIAIHTFDNSYGRRKRYKIFFDQLKYAFEVSKKNAHIPSSHPNQNFTHLLRGAVRIFFNINKK